MELLDQVWMTNVLLIVLGLLHFYILLCLRSWGEMFSGSLLETLSRKTERN